MFRCLDGKKGYSAIVSIILVAGIGAVIAGSFGSVTIAKQKILRNVLNSAQSYYLAEAGIEDAILRIIDPAIPYQLTETLTLASTTVSTTITQTGNNITILSEGDKDNYIRNVQVTLSANTESASFNYGVQVGQGGLEMKNDCTIEGNVYSDGDIIGTNSPTITGDAWAAGAHIIKGFTIGVDAHANTLQNNDIGQDAYYQSISGTTVGGMSYPGSPDPESQALPLTGEQIEVWKEDAAAGGASGSYTLEGDDTASLGPVKIAGNLIIKNSAILTLSGTVWVTGDITLEDNGVLRLDSGYGENSGLLIADGSILIKNNFIVCGSEGYDADEDVCYPENGSYVLLLSTKTGEDAISLENNADINGIIYTSAGEVSVKNNARVMAVTGYEIEVENNVIITYESGLVNLNFSSGPGGGWKIGAWREVE